MERVLTLIKFLVKIMWNNFKIHIKKLITLINFIAVSVAVIFLSESIRLFLSQASIETRKTFLSGIVNPTSSSIYDLSLNLLSVAVLISLGLGLYRFTLTFMFDPVDLRILRPTPVRTSEIYFAKHFRSVVKYMPIIALSFLVFLPVMDYLRLTFVDKMLMLSVILVFFGLLKALENFAFFLTRTLFGVLKAKRVTVGLIVTVSLAIVLILMGGAIHGMIVKALPSTLVTEIILASVASTKTLESLMMPFAALVAGYIGLLELTLAASKWYDKVAKYDEQRQPTLRRLLRGRSFWHLGFWHDPALTIALKDFWVNLRQDFLVNVVLASSLLGIMMLFELGSTKEFALLPFASDAPFISGFIVIVVFMLAALFSPSLDSFTREPGNIWILKTSPIPSIKIIYGKYLCALFTSAFTVAPLLVYAGLLPTHVQWVMIWTIPHMLLISNAVGVYMGAIRPVTSRDQSVSLAQILSSMVLITALIAIVPVGISFFLNKPAQLIIAFSAVTGYTALISYKFLKSASNALRWNEKLL